MIEGKHIAITGILIFYKREEAFSQIICRGGIPQKTVTSETDYLVVGYYKKNALNGSKSNKRLRAEKYINQGQNLKVISEDEFLGMVWNSPVLL